MPTLEDHVVCAPLRGWLAAWLDHEPRGRGCGCAVVGAAPPRALRSLLPEDPGGDELDAIVVISRLDAEVDATPMARLRPGGRVAELALVRRAGLRDLLRPWSFAQTCSDRAVDRVRGWARAGLYDLEQFVALSPVDAIVTLGRRRAP